MAGSIKSFLGQTVSWGRRRQPRIFISYRRRGEGAGYGGRIADKLVEHFGSEQCFRDVDDIESGVDFVKTIQQAVSGCEVLIAVIGPDWITQTDQAGRRRLDDPKDFVRLEVAAALERDIRVIPILVGGAVMPTERQLPEPLQALCRRQAHELSDTRWEYDVTRLLGVIESIGIKRRSPRQRRWLALNWRTAGLSAAGILVLASVLINYAPTFSQSPGLDAPWPTDYQTQTNSQDSTANEMESLLEQERRDRQDAERAAGIERQKRQDLEIQWQKEEEVRTKSDLDFQTKYVAQTKQADTFSGLDGTLRVSWRHEGVVYDAAVTMSGATGTALVGYLDPLLGSQIVVEQDLDLLANGEGNFYVGSNPRLVGTTVAMPLYRGDIFRLAPLQNGSWTIAEVGDTWDHFDEAIVR